MLESIHPSPRCPKSAELSGLWQADHEPIMSSTLPRCRCLGFGRGGGQRGWQRRSVGCSPLPGTLSINLALASSCLFPGRLSNSPWPLPLGPSSRLPDPPLCILHSWKGESSLVEPQDPSAKIQVDLKLDGHVAGVQPVEATPGLPCGGGGAASGGGWKWQGPLFSLVLEGSCFEGAWQLAHTSFCCFYLAVGCQEALPAYKMMILYPVLVYRD